MSGKKRWLIVFTVAGDDRKMLLADGAAVVEKRTAVLDNPYVCVRA